MREVSGHGTRGLLSRGCSLALLAIALLLCGRDASAQAITRYTRDTGNINFVTTGGSTIHAIERVRAEGFEVAGVVSVLDRLAGGAELISAATDGAPYTPLTTIDDVYPDRPTA